LNSGGLKSFKYPRVTLVAKIGKLGFTAKTPFISIKIILMDLA